MMSTLEIHLLYVCMCVYSIGISEKGSATVKLSVSMRPGHSSMPPRETSIGILAAAVKRLEEQFFQSKIFLPI